MDACMDHDIAPVLAAVLYRTNMTKKQLAENNCLLPAVFLYFQIIFNFPEEGREELILNMLKFNMEEKVVVQISGTTVRRLRQIKEKHLMVLHRKHSVKTSPGSFYPNFIKL